MDKESKTQTRANSDQFYFVMPNKVKPPELWKYNIHIFFTSDVTAVASKQIFVPENVKLICIK